MSAERFGESTHELDSIAVDEINSAFTPRLRARDTQHVRLLAQRYEHLLPIVVHRPTMAVIVRYDSFREK
jgi:hypothetical protein